MRLFSGKIYAITGLLVGLAVGYALLPTAQQGQAPQFARENIFDRVLRTETIRCGYVVWPPYLIKDPNTGAMTGMAFDMMQAIGKELNARIEWTEEVGWGSFQEGLNAGRYDAMCTPVWQSGQRAKIALLTRSVFYSQMVAMVRADDQRFDADLAAMNKTTIKIAVIDGDVTQAVRHARFPAAQELAVSPPADPSHMILSVAGHKADVAIADAENMRRYNATVPPQRQLKLAAGGRAVRLFGNTLGVRSGEFAFKAMLDATIETLNTDGTMAALVEKHRQHFTPAAAGFVAE